MTLGWTPGIAAAVGLAVFAAGLFAVAAVLQNTAVAGVVRDAPGPDTTLRLDGMRALLGTPGWLAGVVLATVASTVHAGALVLAPVSIVQPIGVLAVPFAVALAARRTRRWPPAALVLSIVTSLLAVAAFVALAGGNLRHGVAPGGVEVVVATGATAAVVAALVALAMRTSGWVRCLCFAGSEATAFGLVSALMRLVSQRLTTGPAGIGDPGVLLPAAGIGAALLVGGWAVQQAHAAGAPAVVVGCMTVVDPLVAVALGVVMLGEGGTSSPAATLGLVTCATVGLLAVITLARHHPDATTCADPAPVGAAPAMNGSHPRT